MSALDDMFNSLGSDGSGDEDEAGEATFYTADETLQSRSGGGSSSRFDSFMTASPGPDYGEERDEEGNPNGTLTEQQMEEQLAALEAQKQALLQKLKRSGGKDTPSPNSSRERKNNGNLKMVPLDFDGPATKTKKADEPSVFRREDHVDSDEEDEMSDRIKPLTDAGRSMKHALAKSSGASTSSQSSSFSAPSSSLSLSRLAAEVAPKVEKKKEPSKLGIVIGESKEKEMKNVCVNHYDPFFKFKIKSPKVSSDTFDMLCDGMLKVRLGGINAANAPQGTFITMGVLVEKTENRKSANGKEYMIWKMHDLQDTQKPPMKVFLFGDAFKTNSKLMVGIVFALVNPMLNDPSERDKTLSLKCIRSAQIVEIGWSVDLGTCKGIKPDGSSCSNFVNISLSEYCIYHVMAKARAMSSKRGTFNTVSAKAPIKQQMHANAKYTASNPISRMAPIANMQLNASGTMKASAHISFRANEEKVVSKEDEKKELQKLIASRNYLLGARNLVRFEESKTKAVEKPAGPAVAASITDFLNAQDKRDADDAARQKEEQRRARMAALRADRAIPVLGGSTSSSNGLPSHSSHTLSSGTEYRKKTPVDPEVAKRRAIEKLRQLKEEGNGSAKKGVKRPNVDTTPSAKREKLSEVSNKEMDLEMDKLLNRSANFGSQNEKNHIEKYMEGLEAKEKIETFTTTTMSMQNVKVVSCKKCSYTAQKQSDLCMRQGHAVQWHKADKRFFKCKGCKKRTTAYSMLPSKPCEQCDGHDWVRVGMRDERKVTLESEKLNMRGEERKYAGS